jgi:hypothetical protein
MSHIQLEERCQKAAASGATPVALFDLDGTLYDNTWRTLRILQEFAVRRHSDYPALYDAVVGLHPHALEYRLADSLIRAGVSDPQIHAEAFAFWKERFFTNTYQAFDLALPGAVEVVHRLRALGAVIVYFTGRDAPNMLQGTIAALQRDGFPVGTADAHVVMRPDFHQDDTEYKTDAIYHIRKYGQVVAAFDNEPGLANRFQEAFPEALVYHLNTSWAPTAEPVVLHSTVRVIKDFRTLLP